MSKHNYSQHYSKKNYDNNTSIPAVDTVVEIVETAPEFKMEVETVEMIEPSETFVVETAETVALPETVTGVVAGCKKLNVRAEPNMTAEILFVLDASTEIEIDPAKSTSEWLNVCTAAGIEGYCMRKFVDAHL